ncbi:MAG: hypothetical protein JNM78_07605 [Cyclobacteriaceae bacterium]|nr:hypothetical protein [Cyclobacteriaceae bacterium]
MVKKLVYLFLALLLPIGVFLFLRAFGKNEFSIPVYYETEMPEYPASCHLIHKIPYTVPDAILRGAGWQGESAALFIADTSPEVLKNMKHLDEEFTSFEVQKIYPHQDTTRWDSWCTCFFFLKKPWSVVLIDSERKIRGFYAPKSREEMDRLTVELKILLKQY